MLNRIKRARMLKGIRQQELAEKLEISQASVCNWERGKTFPSIDRLKSVAEALDTTVEELLKDREGKEAG